MSAKRCSATAKTTGEACRQFAANDTNVCHYHGGKGPSAIATARRRLALATVSAEMSRLGEGIEVDPGEALLAMVCEATGNVAFLRDRVAELATHPTLRYVTRYDDEGDEDGYEITIVEPGLYGPDHLGDARRHILVSMYDDERVRLAGFARMALAAGVDARRVALAERQGTEVAGVILKVLDALDLSAAQREVGRRVAADQLRQLAVGA